MAQAFETSYAAPQIAPAPRANFKLLHGLFLYILNRPCSSLKFARGAGDLRGCIQSFKHLW